MSILRRKFIAALVGLASMAGGAFAAPNAVETPTRYSFSEVQMGASWRISLYADDQDTANRAASAVFARVAELNGILSDYDPQSELSRLSSTGGIGKAVPLGEDLWNVLWHSQQLAANSGGAFDVTVGPLTKLWRRARRQQEMPRPELLSAARDATGYRALRLDSDRRTAELQKPNMRLDLGGIGMGYAVDEALKVLKRAGVASAMIDASGDIGTLDAPPGNRGWRIGIAPLSGDGPPSRYVSLANMALTNSGDAFQAVELGGQRFSHIVDPHTGLGLVNRSSVVVIAPDCTTADSYATAVAVLGPAQGMKLIDATPGAEAFVVRQADSGQIETSESTGFKKFVEDD
ncbi:MAG: FAD:protein FMN transferase [Pirellulales bacterium]|nr:FAD:protein FMN transferase [Pirellulales bacterium]